MPQGFDRYIGKQVDVVFTENTPKVILDGVSYPVMNPESCEPNQKVIITQSQGSGFIVESVAHNMHDHVKNTR